jgi:hypothetical protein
MARKACHVVGSATQVGLTQALGLMEVSDAHVQKIKDRKLMAFGSWVLVVVFGALSLIAKNFGQELLGSILISAAVLFGALFAFYVLALMLTAVSLIARRTKDRA